MATYQVEGGFYHFTPYEDLKTDLALATIRREFQVVVESKSLRELLALFEDMTDYIRLEAPNDHYANELLKRVEGQQQ